MSEMLDSKPFRVNRHKTGVFESGLDINNDGDVDFQRVAILGSTGSIGQSTLEVLSLHPNKFEIFALTANSNAELLLDQCKRFKPKFVVLCNEEKAIWLSNELKAINSDTELVVGISALNDIAAHAEVDTVMAAIVGAAGLSPTLASVRAGKKILLANKEALVVAGQLFMDAVQNSGATLLPIDSEHNAIFQCLPSEYRTQSHQILDAAPQSENLSKWGIRKLLLTGSGGPFRELALSKFHEITPAQACNHPNWSMGQKISVDSATMMNKGLELIEACWLFNCHHQDIDIIVHPQSVIHSMVEYLDGSVIAQMGQPDMRTPIAHALAWPKRIESAVESLNWAKLSQLTFNEPDTDRFPALKLARHVAGEGGTSAVVLNAANEVAVAAFLKNETNFTNIVPIAEKCLEKIPSEEPSSLEQILVIDKQARQLAISYV